MITNSQCMSRGKDRTSRKVDKEEQEGKNEEEEEYSKRREVKQNRKLTRKIRLRAVDWYDSALSHTALLPKSLL